MNDVLRLVHEAFFSDEPNLDALRTRGLDRKTLLEMAAKAERGKDGDTGVRPDMSAKQALEKLSLQKRSERINIAKLLGQLAKEIDQPRQHAHSVVMLRNKEVMVEGKPERQNRLFVHYRPKLMIGKSKSILLIDADADAEINGRLFGTPLEHVVIPAARNAYVTQCHSRSFSKYSLLPDKGDSDRSKDQAELLKSVKTIIKRMAQEARLLVVCNLPVRRAITGEKANNLPLSSEWNGATISHFGRIKGVDDWKHYEVVLIIGREQPRPSVMEDIARAIWDDAAEPLNLTGSYEYALRGYNLKDVPKAGVNVHVHPDPRVQSVLELTRERGCLQALDRIRLIHAIDIKRVILLGKLPLDLVVNQLLSFQELLDGRASNVERALALNGGALPLAPEILASMWPVLFLNERAARHEIASNLQAIQSNLGSTKCQ